MERVDGNSVQHLRILIANVRRDRLELLAQVVAGLGHEVIAREVDVTAVGAVTAREHPDVALVGLGLSSEHVGHHHGYKPCGRRRHARGEGRPRDRVHDGGRRRADHRNRG
jgi:hypothetical protein